MKRMIVLLSFVVVTPALAQVRVRMRDHTRPVRVIRVEAAPPAPRVEVRVEAPSRGHVWEPGYWSWTGDRYIWMEGHWVMPPQPAQVWVEPRWVNEGGYWVFHDGYWSNAAAPEPAGIYGGPSEPRPYQQQEWVVETAPPPPQQETIPPPPGRHFVWVPGYWAWEGRRHVWVAGSWEAERPGRRFVPNRWERRGHGWKFRRGGWH